MKSARIKDNVVKVSELWTDMSETVHCQDIGHSIQLQQKVTERFKSGQIRAYIVRCKTPCGRKTCDYAKSNN